MRVVTRPLTLDQKIKAIQDNIYYEAKRIWVCSYIFIALGAIGFFTGINQTFTVRTEAAFLRETHQEPFGNPNFTNWTILNATKPVPDRVEMVFFDLMREICIIKSALAALVVMMGLAGLATVNRGKALFAQGQFRRVFFTFMVFLIFSVYNRKHNTNYNYMVKFLKQGAFNETNVDSFYINLPQHIQADKKIDIKVEEPVKRNLESKELFKVGKDSDQCKADHATQSDCDSDAACTWCACKAVPSRCWSVEDAKRLPQAVYVCDAKEENKKDDPPAPTWPEMQPLHAMMLFLTLASVYLVTFLKFIEKSYAKVEFYQGAKKLVKYPAKNAVAPVTAAPEPTQVVDSFDYSIDEEQLAPKNDMC